MDIREQIKELERENDALRDDVLVHESEYVKKLEKENARLRNIVDGIYGDHYFDILSWYFKECDRLRERLAEYEKGEYDV